MFDAFCAFDMGLLMHLLNSGNGFPGSEDVKLKFEEITNIMNQVLEKKNIFPQTSEWELQLNWEDNTLLSVFTLTKQLY